MIEVSPRNRSTFRIEKTPFSSPLAPLFSFFYKQSEMKPIAVPCLFMLKAAKKGSLQVPSMP